MGEITQAVSQFKERIEPFRPVLTGWMIDANDPETGSPKVEGEPGYVFVLVERGEGVTSGDVIKAWSRFRPVAGWPVRVGITKERDWEYSVLDIDTVAMGGAIDGLSDLQHHAETHDWGHPTGSDDPTYPRFLQLYDFGVWPGLGLTVNVGSGIFNPSGTLRQDLAYTSSDLTALAPAWGQRYILVTLTPGGTIHLTAGTIRSFLTLDDIPARPGEDHWELAAVRIRSTDTEIIQLPDNVNILDLRFSRLGWPWSTSTGGRVDWENVIIVAKGGGDYTTIQAGESTRVVADLLLVMKGDYDENVQITTAAPMASISTRGRAANVRVMGGDDVGPLLDLDETMSVISLAMVRALTGAGGAYIGVDASDNTYHINLIDCRIILDDDGFNRNMTGVKITGESGGESSVLCRCVIEVTGTGGGTIRAVDLAGEDVTIEDCVITGDIVASAVTNLTLRNCTIDGDVTGSGGADVLTIGPDCVITGNISGWNVAGGVVLREVGTHYDFHIQALENGHASYLRVAPTGTPGAINRSTLMALFTDWLADQVNFEAVEVAAFNDGVDIFGVLRTVKGGTGTLRELWLGTGGTKANYTRWDTSGNVTIPKELTVASTFDVGGTITKDSRTKEFFVDGSGLDTTLALAITFTSQLNRWVGHIVEVLAVMSDSAGNARYSSIVRYSITSLNTLLVTDMTHDLVGGVTEAVGTAGTVLTITLTFPGAVAIDFYSVCVRITSGHASAVVTGIAVS